jgi:methylated-DNA-[protein]-cysteine S-methyltransferase
MSSLCNHYKAGPPLILEVHLEKGIIQRTCLLPSIDEKGLSCLIYSKKSHPSIPEQIFAWLSAYVSKRPYPFPFDLCLPPSFNGKVLKEIQKIPFGKKMSYKDIAQQAGNSKASRAVGNACRDNPFPLFIPCHRVINSNGGLGGFAYELKIKRSLLDFETHEEQKNFIL